MPLTLIAALRGRPRYLPPPHALPPVPTFDAAAFPTPEIPTLGPLAARSAAVLRLAWCVITPIVAYGAGSPAEPTAWRHLLIVGALLWGLVVARVCWRGRLPVWLVVVDVAVCAVLLVGMVTLLPATGVGAAGSWVMGWAGVSVLLGAWRLRPAHAWALAGLQVVAYLVGSRLAGVRLGSADPWQLTLPIAATLQAVGTLLALTAIGLVLVRLVRLGAMDAASTLGARNAARHLDRIEQARLHDRNARRLLLHDTVLTTLTAIARGGLRGRAEVVRERCRDDLAALVDDREGSAARTGVELIQVAQQQGAHRGLDVYVAGEAPDDRLPADVAAAFGAGIRESLSNIEKHAGISEVGITALGSGDRLEIRVHDAGRGFDPTTARPGGLGLEKSLRGRMRSVGGSATVNSAPGRGTLVTLRWPEPVGENTPDEDDDEARDLPDAARLVADRYTRYGLLALAWIGHFWQALSLGLLITSWSGYRSGPAALVGWFVLFVVTLVQVYLVTRRGNADRGAAWMVPLSVGAALLVLGVCSADGLVSPANWPIAVLGWILTVFALRQPRWFDLGWLTLAIGTIVAVWVAWDGSGSMLALALGTVFGAGIPQVGALILVMEQRRHATAAATAIADQHRLASARAARAAVTTDRAARDASLSRGLLPLLRSLADGSVDPDDPGERRRCELAAAEVRALVDHDDLTTPIETLDAVAAVTLSAKERDVIPIVHFDDDLDAVSPGWQRAFTRLVDRMLAEALPGEATLTVRGEPDALAVTLCFPTRTPAPQLERVAAGAGAELVPDRLVRVDVEPDTSNIAWLEVTWETRTAV